MKLYGFTKKELLGFFSTMALSRQLDEKQLTLLKQGKGFFHIGAAGHEAAQVAAGSCFIPGQDYAFPYYRDQGLCLQWGMTSREIFLSFMSRKDDPNSGGRQMPQHYSHHALRIVTQSSPTGTQYLQAVGAAFACKRAGNNAVVYVSSGEGTTSQGDFHEALNWASRAKAPVIFHIENNGYAISVPVEEQTAGGSIYKIAAGYESLARFNVNGTDLFETRMAFMKAVERARRGKGPGIIVSNVVRLFPHSSSDDQRKYRSNEELEADRRMDPLHLFQKRCIDAGICTDNDFESIYENVKVRVNEDAVWAESQDAPDPGTIALHLYSANTPPAGITVTKTGNGNRKTVLVDAINHALDEELAFNDKMVIYGQDVAGKKGGVFTATRGLTGKFGKHRVFNSPLAESSIIGTAVGAALCGMKPVVEIQFGDYIWTAMMQLRNEVATIRYRSNGVWSCPMVIRVPVGGYIHGGLCHSQSIDGYFTHLPGIFIAYPSNAADAKGLLKMACRMDDPVLFLEHKGLYRQGYAAATEPSDDYLLPFGKANYALKGDDLTLVTWGACVQKCIEAVRKTGMSADIIDMRTLNPLDMVTILESLKKNNRILIVHEDNLTGGFGAEIAARIAAEGFEFLDAPVKRIASKDLPVAYAPALENAILVQTDWIIDAIHELITY